MKETKYYEVRRKSRQISEKEALAVLEEGDYGTLSTVGEDGQPYGVPLSYAVMNGRIYFHCALEGHKLDNIAAESRVCFSAVSESRPVFQEDYTVTYKSVTVFGKASLVSDPREIEAAYEALVKKYFPEYLDELPRTIEKFEKVTAVVSISMDYVTGKARPDDPS